jgi:hypothetical protein
MMLDLFHARLSSARCREEASSARMSASTVGASYVLATPDACGKPKRGRCAAGIDKKKRHAGRELTPPAGGSYGQSTPGGWCARLPGWPLYYTRTAAAVTDPTRSDTPADLDWCRQNAAWLATLLDDVEVLRPDQLRILVLYLSAYDSNVLEEALWFSWGLEGPGARQPRNAGPSDQDDHQEQPER